MKLQAFLYLLIRDHLPTGVVEKLLATVLELDRMAGDGESLDPQFSSEQLADLVSDWAMDLAGG